MSAANTIFRAAHDTAHPFVQVSKKSTNDKKLSFGARGLLGWLLDKPNTWKIDPDAIARESETSLYEVKTLMKELAQRGYLINPRRIRVRGKFDYTPYLLRETPDIKIPELDTDERKPFDGNRSTETDERQPDDGDRETGRAEGQAQNPPTQTTTAINDSKNESVDGFSTTTTTTAPGGGGYVIPALTAVDLWEASASTLPAEIEQAARSKAVEREAQKPSPPVSPAPSPVVEQVSDVGDAARAYERYVGLLTSKSLDMLPVLVEDYGLMAVVEAFKGAFGKDRPEAYALSTLRRQAAAGELPGKSTAPTLATQPTAYATGFSGFSAPGKLASPCPPEQSTPKPFKSPFSAPTRKGA